MATLSIGALTKILVGTPITDPYLQVTSIQTIQQTHASPTKYRLDLSDGEHTQSTLLPDKFKDLVIEEALVKGSIICLKNFSCKMLHNFTAILIEDFDIFFNNAPIVGSPIPILQVTDYLQPSPFDQGSSSTSATKYSVQNLAPFQPLSIKSLTPYHRHWSIKGRALGKTPIHEYKNGSREGKVFGFEFIDKDTSGIHVTCFNELVDEFYNVVNPGSLYKISGGRIKVADTKYSSSTNPYEIVLLSSSIITPSLCLDSTIPKHCFHFKSIDTLDTFPIDSLVDVIGIVVSTTPPSTIRKKNGTNTKKCTTTIKDISNCSIDITLWGQHCEIEGKKIFDMFAQESPVIILMKSARLISWNGKKLDSTFSTSIIINPTLPEASALKIWYTSVGNDQPSTPLSKGQSYAPKFVDPKYISTIVNKELSNTQPICVKAKITKLHLDKFYYLSCPLVVDNKKCKKKVVRSSTNKFQCPKCSVELSNCAYSYMLKMDLQDGTGELLKVTAFEGPSIDLLGVPAEDFQLLLAEPDGAKYILDNIINCEFLFELTIKMYPFAGEETQSIVVTALKLA